MTSGTLVGKRVVVGVTGSIAAVEVVHLVHALREAGAEVHGVITSAGSAIIHPDVLAYATGRPVVTRCTGMVEHVEYCGEGGLADLLLIAPCTANTLAKCACGIDDTPVTTFATTAIGRGMPVVIAPAMHGSMYRHPAIASHIRTLRSWGIIVVDPRIEDGKAKIADSETIQLWCERAILGGPLSGRRVLITSGPCREPLDDIRVLTTRSSGRMGRELALQAFRLGADVTVIHADTFPCVKNIRARTASEMREAVLGCLSGEGTDIYVSAAAISDFAPEQVAGKIRSGARVTIGLSPLPKLLDEVMEKFHPVTVAFKLGEGEEERAREMIRSGISIVVCNAPIVMGADEGEFVLLAGERQEVLRGNKSEVARAIWSALR